MENQNEINKNTLKKALDDCKNFIDNMTYPELQGVGIAMSNSIVKIDATDEEGTEYTADKIYDSLKEIAENGEAGDEIDFNNAYTKIILSAHMMFAISTYNGFLKWFSDSVNLDVKLSPKESEDNTGKK